VTREKQLKDKIKKWGLKKNVNTTDMTTIARACAKRKRYQEKDSTVRLCGKRVPNAKVDRFMKRQG
jgi:hypothetical protein